MNAAEPAGNENKHLGLIAALCAYTFWGMFPLFFQLIKDIDALEILMHRMVWSVPFAGILICFRRQIGDVIQAFKKPKVLVMLCIAAVSIALNWFIYTWAVTHDRILEASLGYYINPLMYVIAGVFILKEPLRPMQTIAVSLATISVTVLTIWQGAFPWIPLSLAGLFTAYGYIRKTIDVGALPGLFVEVVMLSPIAIIYILWLAKNGNSVFLSGGVSQDIYLVLLGPLTVIPLTLFSIAARRLPLITLGFLQYIGPTVQFVVGVFLGEAFTLAHGVSFGLIWIALAVFTVDSVRAVRA